MKILGIDIGKGIAVCCILEQKHLDNPKNFILNRSNFYHFKANAEGIKGILELKPEIAILEPTGINYAKLWATKLAEQGIQIKFVAHKALAAHRIHLGLSDKEDETDSYALAHYGHTYNENPMKFNRIKEPIISQMRHLVLRLEHINRLKNPINNRLKQDLQWQFPEIADNRTKTANETPPLLIRWLAGEAKSKAYDKKYSKTVGLGLTEESRLGAQRLLSLINEEIEIERKLIDLTDQAEFLPYKQVLMGKIKLGLRTTAILISQIYPFENFLKDGKPIEEWHSPRQATVNQRKKDQKTDLNAKTLKHISLRRFEKTLGIAPTENSSGKSQKRSISDGASLCRKAIWRWIFSNVEVQRMRKKNPIANDLYIWANSQGREGKPIKLKRMKLASKLVRLIFNELTRTIGAKP